MARRSRSHNAIDDAITVTSDNTPTVDPRTLGRNTPKHAFPGRVDPTQAEPQGKSGPVFVKGCDPDGGPNSPDPGRTDLRLAARRLRHARLGSGHAGQQCRDPYAGGRHAVSRSARPGRGP